MSPQTPVVITLTPAQRALIRQASGKAVRRLRIEPQETASGWLYAPEGGKELWFLKHPDLKSYADAKRRHRPHIDSRFARYRLTIRTSKIHRYGVFAGERIPARRRVIEYTGERVNPPEAYRRTKKADEIYLYRLSEFWRLDGSVGGSGAEFINHSCDPNLRTRISRGRIFLLSKRPIEIGEELTIDYRFPRESPAVRCHCGSPKCRGTINRSD